MKKESTTFGLSSEKMAKLFSIGAEIVRSEKESDQDQVKAELLSDRLAETLPLDRSMAKYLPAALIRLCDRLGVLAGEPIGKLIENPESDVWLIRKVKNYSKNLSECAKSEAENDTAIAIYYAAIANALAFRGRRITKFSMESLDSSFASLIDKPWMPKEFIALFRKAQQLCQGKLIKTKKQKRRGK